MYMIYYILCFKSKSHYLELLYTNSVRKKWKNNKLLWSGPNYQRRWICNHWSWLTIAKSLHLADLFQHHSPENYVGNLRGTCGYVLTIDVTDGEELQGMLRRYLQLLFWVIRQGRIVKLLTPKPTAQNFWWDGCQANYCDSQKGSVYPRYRRLYATMSSSNGSRACCTIVQHITTCSAASCQWPLLYLYRHLLLISPRGSCSDSSSSTMLA